MTEQQIEQLKQVLDTSNAAANSTELDDAILRSASKQADRIRRDFGPQTKQPWFGFLSSSAIGAVAVSILLTVGVFAALSQLLKTDPELYTASQASTKLGSPIELEFDSDAAVDVSIRETSMHVKRPPVPTAMSNTREQILAQITRPNVQALLSNMEFSLDTDRDFAEQSVLLAMNDIRAMIGQGQIEQARQRYAQLRQVCDVCTLPSTLDALVMNASPATDSG